MDAAKIETKINEKSIKEDEELKYPIEDYIRKEFPDKEVAISITLKIYNALYERKIVSSFVDFVMSWDILPKTRQNFSEGNAELY